MQALNTIQGILEHFTPISLQEMDDVALMERVETKFLCSDALLPSIIAQLKGHYKVLRVRGVALCGYHTSYYDTPSLDLYMAHQNERASRYKVRYRSYVESQVAFIEVKIRNNKGKVIKKRISYAKNCTALTVGARAFIKKNSGIDTRSLIEAVTVTYRRITLTSHCERVTIDIGISFSAGEASFAMPHLAIVEVKQALQGSSPALDILKKEKLQKTSVSKYCLAIMATRPGIKQNNFKQKMRFIRSLTAM